MNGTAVATPGYRHRMEWRRPTLVVYETVTRRLKVHLNRYPGVVIGVGLQVGLRVLSLTWGRPGKVQVPGRHRAAA